jgi:septal ring factor EnvC (AmiA/AmiB activator)
MSDIDSGPSPAVSLAREVINKYGGDSDKPSVKLAIALVDGAHERDSLRASLLTLQSDLARVEGEREKLRTWLDEANDRANQAACDALNGKNTRDRLLVELGETITQRDAARARAEAAEAVIAATAELEAQRDQAAAAERERIAQWLESWEPDYYADAADNDSMSVDAVLALAAERIRNAHRTPEES